MVFVTRLIAAATLGLSFVVGSAIISRRVPHEVRRSNPAGWYPVRRADSDAVLRLRVGLKQNNIDEIESYLLDVSHPESPNYGKHWTPAKVAETFRPSAEAIDTVQSWLLESGLEAHRFRLSASGGWIQANVTIEEAESLLGTEYYVYRFSDEAFDEHIACEGSYHLPEHVSKHVELVTPTLHFDVKPKIGRTLEKRDSPAGPARRIGQPGFGSGPKTTGRIENLFNELANCDEQITLDCLRALYEFDYVPLATKKNSLGIVEYTPQVYVPSDLDMFFKNFSESQIGERPTMVSIDGGFLQTNQTGFDFNGESNLDLEYAMGLVGKEQKVTLYQTGDDLEGASFNNLLDALDSTFCTFEGGDDPTQDGVYPDPEGGFQGPNQCGGAPLSLIISTSYGYNEADLTPFYMQRQCSEYAKLGLMGVTVLYSSGDDGVAGNGEVCLEPDGEQTLSGQIFNPSFPGGCPFVTSVGATQVSPGKKVTDPESACEQVIFSGGGFSNVFAIPEYQKSAVESYLTKFPPPYPSDIWNSTGKSRAFPDIAANGANYVITVQGEFLLVFGTSCASPVSAAILSGVNDARLALGKSPIGFINPTIYSTAFHGAFNDITNGTNPGCGTVGFSARPGWDPVTGLGTPNFPQLLARWLLLP
ncbi:hypothetical protein CERSUDRAFT_84189 [Gelatoporia subvermispora B]|uniref:tripeptidyl-peptidase II n=1 Tax=Ceriporiopsis subvermispora (strain B) TaxID=914234 RepID=M2PLD9_CERS8|nr:hypothetical protein CERSUDRAFT_84189 [Gelatoporia subvermispora B]